MKPKSIILADFCQTIVTVDSFPLFVKHVCFKKIGFRTILYIIYALLNRLGIVIHKSFKVKLLKGIAQDELELLCRGYCRDQLIPNINNKAIEYIKSELSDASHVIIVSAAVNNYIKYLKLDFEVDRILAANLGISENGLTNGKIDGELIFGSEKVTAIDNYLMENNIQRSQIELIAISDSINDLPMLNISDKKIVIGGVCKKLTDLAKKKNWKLI